MSKHSLTLNFINFWRVFVVVWCDTSRRRDVWCVMVCIVLYLIWDHLPLTLIWSMLNGCVNFLDKIYGLLPSRTPPIPKPCLLRPWPLLWPTLLLPPLQIPLTLLLRHDRNPVPRPRLERRTPSLLPPRIKTQDTKKDRAPTDSSSPDAVGGDLCRWRHGGIRILPRNDGQRTHPRTAQTATSHEKHGAGDYRVIGYNFKNSF